MGEQIDLYILRRHIALRQPSKARGQVEADLTFMSLARLRIDGIAHLYLQIGSGCRSVASAGRYAAGVYIVNRHTWRRQLLRA